MCIRDRCHGKIENHSLIRDKILKEMSYTQDGSLNAKDLYFHDRISKLDWDYCRDFSRPWTKIFLPEFIKTVEPMVASMGYTSMRIIDMWYQQYMEGDTHGWHVHGQHFTGVYYLEYPEGCSKTEVCSPFDLKAEQMDTVEGDLIVFPAHYIHRGLPNSDIRKTMADANSALTLWDDLSRTGSFISSQPVFSSNLCLFLIVSFRCLLAISVLL